MYKALILLSIYFITCAVAIAQEEDHYFIDYSKNGPFLLHDTRIAIDVPAEACYEFIEEIEVREGDEFIIVHIKDEMQNDQGVVIFNKKGDQINYDAVQHEREKHYQPYNCCVFVEELNGKLYFYDVLNAHGESKDYDCSDDSQSDISILIPRYYVFDYKTNHVKKVFLKNECSTLIQDGKVICD